MHPLGASSGTPIACRSDANDYHAFTLRRTLVKRFIRLPCGYSLIGGDKGWPTADDFA